MAESKDTAKQAKKTLIPKEPLPARPPAAPPEPLPVVQETSGFQRMFWKIGALVSRVFSKAASVLPKPNKPKMEARYVPETPREIAEKRGEDGIEFETEVDAFLKLVREKKRISLAAAASELGESEVVVEEWATILDRSGLVKLVYPGNPMESPYVVLQEPGTNNNNRT